ncbi:MAG: polysaccharide deacetylase family protein [Actinobacteria bacterium]|nr:polysaccharide deacetylase family protein [Actinomycetota bacterium]
MKNKLFPLISILILLTLVGTAATCNLCGITPTKKTVSSDSIENKADQTSIQTTKARETAADAPKEETTAEVSIVIREGIVNHETKQIALTFDAGWLYENTEALLNLLDKYNVKATFFVRGLWVKDHPDLATEIVNRGHDLENHSLTHGHMSTMTDAEVENEIRGTTDIIRETTGYLPNLFRPPYGEYDKRILRILKQEGYPYTILWTVDSYDWAEELNGVKITKDYLVNRVLNKASGNGIILMHVGGYETIQALPEIINGLISEGYELVKVNDML